MMLWDYLVDIARRDLLPTPLPAAAVCMQCMPNAYICIVHNHSAFTSTDFTGGQDQSALHCSLDLLNKD